MKKAISIIILIFVPLLLFSQEEQSYVKKSFLIIYSSKDYKSALNTAKKASKELNLTLDLRDLAPCDDPITGLTIPIDENDEQGGYIYVPRGRNDDGDFISIEYTTAYVDFAKGYYIVVASCGNPKDKKMKALLKKVKAKYPDAYIKTSLVYMGCID